MHEVWLKCQVKSKSSLSCHSVSLRKRPNWMPNSSHYLFWSDIHTWCLVTLCSYIRCLNYFLVQLLDLYIFFLFLFLYHISYHIIFVFKSQIILDRQKIWAKEQKTERGYSAFSFPCFFTRGERYEIFKSFFYMWKNNCVYKAANFGKAWMWQALCSSRGLSIPRFTHSEIGRTSGSKDEVSSVKLRGRAPMYRSEQKNHQEERSENTNSSEGITLFSFPLLLLKRCK